MKNIHLLLIPLFICMACEDDTDILEQGEKTYLLSKVRAVSYKSDGELLWEDVYTISYDNESKPANIKGIYDDAVGGETGLYTITYSYYPNGLLKSVEEGDSDEKGLISYTYTDDWLPESSTIMHTGGEPEPWLTYEVENGKVASMIREGATWHLTYDDQGRVKSMVYDYRNGTTKHTTEYFYADESKKNPLSPFAQPYALNFEDIGLYEGTSLLVREKSDLYTTTYEYEFNEGGYPVVGVGKSGGEVDSTFYTYDVK